MGTGQINSILVDSQVASDVVEIASNSSGTKLYTFSRPSPLPRWNGACSIAQINTTSIQYGGNAYTSKINPSTIYGRCEITRPNYGGSWLPKGAAIFELSLTCECDVK